MEYFYIDYIVNRNTYSVWYTAWDNWGSHIYKDIEEGGLCVSWKLL